MGKKSIHFSLVVIAIVFGSCNKDSGPFSNSVSDINPDDTVSYSGQVQPIFDLNCTSCHNENHSKLDLRPTVSYNELLFSGFSAPYIDTINPDQSNLYKHLTGVLSQMPPSFTLTDTELDIIFYWMQQGALNN